MNQLPEQARPAWEALNRERAEELQIIENQEQVKSEVDIKITEARDRIAQIDRFMSAFMSFYLQPDPATQVETDLTPGGPCPLSGEDLLAISPSAGEYPAALVALARATPGRHLHGRTAARWLMDAGVLAGNLDASRTKISKHMGRSPEWEQIAPGWYRLIDQNPTTWFPFTAEEDQPGPAGEETVVGGGEWGTSAQCRRLPFNDKRP